MDVSASALSSGVVGIQAGQQRVERAAAELAGGVAAAPSSPKSTLSLSDMATQMVELTVGRLEVQAGARVVETADEILGTLVNIRA